MPCGIQFFQPFLKKNFNLTNDITMVGRTSSLPVHAMKIDRQDACPCACVHAQYSPR